MSSATATKLSRMQRWFPATASPLIVSAPMAGVTNPKLASEVIRAKGLGFIQGGRTFKPDSPALAQLEEQLSLTRSLLPTENTEKSLLPVGVGFVLFSDCAARYFAETTAPILARHRPAAVWLFAPDPDRPDTLRRVIEALRAAASDWSPRVVVQVGTVAAARQAAELGADVIVAQGAEAGGHQFVRAAGAMSLVPEVRDMVRDEFPSKEIAVWAAGGIADGRGVAAALALGAEAAVLGTRYMVAPESDAENYKRQALLAASDGATSTVKYYPPPSAHVGGLLTGSRSYVHDHVQSNFTWPTLYDARALVHQSYHDDLAGMTIVENEARYKAAKEKGDVSIMVTWSGSSVGLIKSALPAAQITKQVRDEAVGVIEGLKASL
ncbi:hypothetical protein GQX73_g1420 [Xylaria multiplex]|uniref:Uncharacterized protein n=1 Tax=Xylaria multiplex TaxID=323545 RepID=A0A7C8J270_9PEZI|nr:hypothetical protein GQX73_g1420 [Xylaria multiplex]